MNKTNKQAKMSSSVNSVDFSKCQTRTSTTFIPLHESIKPAAETSVTEVQELTEAQGLLSVRTTGAVLFSCSVLMHSKRTVS